MSALDEAQDWSTVWNDRSAGRADWNGYEGCFEDPAEYLAFVRTVVDVIGDTLEITAGDTVLDLGCGTGRMTREIGDRAASVVGVDFSHTALAVARQKRNRINVRYQWGDLNEINPQELPDTDKAYAVGSLFYLDSLAKVWRILDALLASGTRVLLLDLPDADLPDRRERDYDTSRFRHLRFREQDFVSRYGGVTVLRGLFGAYVNDSVRFGVHIAPT